MAAWAWGPSNKHSFADTEIEITTTTYFRAFSFKWHWRIRVVATMRPRRLLRRFGRKTATDTANIVLEVEFPEDGGEGAIGITEARTSGGSVSAMYTYSTNPWKGQGWRFWLRRRTCVIRYSIQVEHLGIPHAFSGDLQVLEPFYGLA